MATKDHSKTYRATKKAKAAKAFGVPESEITEVRILIPRQYKEKVIDYVERMKKW